jgi:hypothetical protein
MNEAHQKKNILKKNKKKNKKKEGDGSNSVENKRNEQCCKSQTRIMLQINQQLQSLRSY